MKAPEWSRNQIIFQSTLIEVLKYIKDGISRPLLGSQKNQKTKVANVLQDTLYDLKNEDAPKSGDKPNNVDKTKNDKLSWERHTRRYKLS